MTAELTIYEAEILIAGLAFAEGAALDMNPSMVEALNVLRPWRSALLQAYLSTRLAAITDEGFAGDPAGDEAAGRI